VNIHVRIFAILERLAITLAFAQKVADFIGKLKNGYHVLIAESLQLLLVADVQIISEGTMLPNTIIDFDQKVFDQRCKKDFN
jgi:hypothetical protein